MWRHRLRDQSIHHRPFAIGCPLVPSLYLLTFSRYATPKPRAHTHTVHTRRKWFYFYILCQSMYCIGQTIMVDLSARHFFEPIAVPWALSTHQPASSLTTWDGGSLLARARPERPASCIKGSRCWFSATMQLSFYMTVCRPLMIVPRFV